MEISKEEYDRLLHGSESFEALEIAGVDNWEGYELALSELNKRRLEDKKLYSLSVEISEKLECLAFEPSERSAGFSFRDDPIAIILDLFKKYNVRLKVD